MHVKADLNLICRGIVGRMEESECEFIGMTFHHTPDVVHRHSKRLIIRPISGLKGDGYMLPPVCETDDRSLFSTFLEPGSAGIPRLGHPTSGWGYDAVLFYRGWRSGDDLPASLAQAMMWALRGELPVAP